ncbi:O-antigen ligase family protein [Polynucleobacter sp. MWH-UH19D]|uniref:O-antigen ligase family protein n=1 Tax=Polynucleobacter sp. MWH-UH19D TaxID=1855610 RepID=UPI003364F7BE
MKIQEKYLANISVLSACTLLWIWVLPDTIALRNILLVIGAITGILMIWQNRNLFTQPSIRLAPLLLISCIFVWVAVHYLFFSINPQLELSEIKSLWLRAFAGALMATGLAIALQRNQHLQKYFFFSLFAVPIINLFAYVYASYLHDGLVKPNEFVRFLFIKIETTYFGAIASAFAIANLIYFLIFRRGKIGVLNCMPFLIGLALVLLSSLIVGTKNGVAISIALCLFFGAVLFLDALRNIRKRNVLSIFICGLIVVVVALVWKGHKSTAYEGWDTLFSDAKIAVQIDKYHQWQKGEHQFERPTNDIGTLVVGNTYFRLAWATVGLRLIKNYPFGYGSINRSFVGLLDEAGLEHVHQGQVHSGWIDFGLAYGVPGLVFIFLAMLSIILFGLVNPSLLNLCGAMICVALIPMGIIAEITYKQYFEATIFFLCLAASLIFLERSSNKKLPND